MLNPQPLAAISPAGTPVPAGQFACLTGFLQPRPPIGIPFRGDFLLVNLQGQVIASLTPAAGVNPGALTGRLVTVCGVSEGQVEGVTSIRATAAFLPSPAGVPGLQNPLLLLTLLSLLQPGVLGGRPTPFGFAPGPFGI